MTHENTESSSDGQILGGGGGESDFGAVTPREPGTVAVMRNGASDQSRMMEDNRASANAAA